MPNLLIMCVRADGGQGGGKFGDRNGTIRGVWEAKWTIPAGGVPDLSLELGFDLKGEERFQT